VGLTITASCISSRGTKELQADKRTKKKKEKKRVKKNSEERKKDDKMRGNKKSTHNKMRVAKRHVILKIGQRGNSVHRTCHANPPPDPSQAMGSDESPLRHVVPPTLVTYGEPVGKTGN
jgi:hypothetical protein